MMRNSLILILTIIMLISCFDSHDDLTVDSINLPTDSPWGLTHDGDNFWYSDDSLNCLIKISNNGEILENIQLQNICVTGIDFHDGYFWCINDSIILHDTTLNYYPFKSIYKISGNGEVLDTFYVEASINPQGHEFLAIEISDSLIIGTTYQGYSSHIYKINLETKEYTFLNYCPVTGLCTYNDTLYGLRISVNLNAALIKFNADCSVNEDYLIQYDFKATNLTAVSETLWAIDRDENTLKKIR